MELEEIRKAIDELGADVKRNRRADPNKIKDTESNFKKSAGRIAKEVMNSENSEMFVKVSELLGLILKAQGVSSNQMRNIFGYVKKQEADIKGLPEGAEIPAKTIMKLKLLSPKMAYIIGRAQRYSANTLEVLKIFFDDCISEIEKSKSKEQFQRFIDMFESILSYHKYYGGK